MYTLKKYVAATHSHNIHHHYTPTVLDADTTKSTLPGSKNLFVVTRKSSNVF